MFKLRAFSTILPLLFVSIFISYNANAQRDLIENGSFETGDFTGWTVLQNVNSAGDWFVYSGDLAPSSSITVLPPPDGKFAAITDQTSPSSQVLYQDIDVPGGATNCSLVYYYRSSADFVTGPDLSQQDGPNQQARIDILDPTADPFDVGSGVLLNLFQTNPGDPLSVGYTTLNFNLSDFAGTTVRLRAVEADNQSNLNFAIDNVQCLLPENVPTLSEWGMILTAGGLMLAGVFFAARRRRAIVNS